nr:MAG TPA: hypothetical protein [Caudoviricetes sp.]
MARPLPVCPCDQSRTDIGRQKATALPRGRARTVIEIQQSRAVKKFRPGHIFFKKGLT